MSNDSGAFDEGSRFKQSKLNRPLRGRILIEKTNLTEELGQTLCDKYYPYYRSRFQESESSASACKSHKNNKSRISSVSSCDSISSIDSNRDVHSVSEKAVERMASINHLNSIIKKEDKLICHTKEKKNKEKEEEHETRQIVYYDAEKNVDYTKTINKIIVLLKEMNIEGVSEIFRRNNFDSKIEITNSEEDKKQESHAKNFQSITLFKADITRKENDEYVINLKDRGKDPIKYQYKPCDEETIPNIVDQIMPEPSEMNLEPKKEENDILFTPRHTRSKRHKYTLAMTAVDTDSNFVRTYERFKSEFKDKRFDKPENFSINNENCHTKTPIDHVHKRALSIADYLADEPWMSPTKKHSTLLEENINEIPDTNNIEYQHDMHHNDNFINSLSSISCDLNYSMLNKLLKAETEAMKSNDYINKNMNTKDLNDFTGNVSVFESSDFKDEPSFEEDDFNNESSASFEEF